MKLGKEKSLEEQLIELKKKEAEMTKKIEAEKEAKRKQDELNAQLEKEQKLIEEKEAREAHLKIEADKAKEKEREQQEKAKQEAIKLKQQDEITKAKEKLKDHPDGCFCPECNNIRDRETLLNGMPVPLENEKPIEKEVPKKQSKFSGIKFNMPKRKPKPEVLKKEDLSEYNRVKKDPNALLLFIKKQRTKLQKHAEVEKAKDIIKKEGAIDTKVQPSIFTDFTVLGIRLAIGFTFIAHGLSKLHEDMAGFIPLLEAWGVPTELAFPIALAELIAGILITMGILTRISSVLIGIIMLGAIFVVKGVSTLTGQGGVELDVIIIACIALLGIFGPGRLSVANIGIKGMIFDRRLQ